MPPVVRAYGRRRPPSGHCRREHYSGGSGLLVGTKATNVAKQGQAETKNRPGHPKYEWSPVVN